MANEPEYSDVLKKYPRNRKNETAAGSIRNFLTRNKMKVVVLDDDPTGIQTVHGCLLATDWKPGTLHKVMAQPGSLFYILTNTRAKTEAEAAALNTEIVHSVIELNKKFNYRLIFISRSDSTLRGHFPSEPLAVKKEIQKNELNAYFPIVFTPAFFETGRYTLDNVHYLVDKGKPIPVGDTEFANDPVFQYKNSNLINYIIEKSNNTVNRAEIGLLSIDAIRNLSLESLQKEIENLKDKKYIVVNALDYPDLKKASLAILKTAVKKNLTLTLRGSSSLPKALGGIRGKKFLRKKDLIKRNAPGIVLVGSHVDLTTRQLNELLKSDTVAKFELDVNEILRRPEEFLNATLTALRAGHAGGRTLVLFTSRNEANGADRAERLSIGAKISGFLADIVKNLPFIPSFIIAKGGITAHDILVKGLDVQTATVKGQIIAGVPVLMTDKKCRYPRMPFIIFPGNVGDEKALAAVYQKLVSS